MHARGGRPRGHRAGVARAPRRRRSAAGPAARTSSRWPAASGPTPSRTPSPGSPRGSRSCRPARDGRPSGPAGPCRGLGPRAGADRRGDQRSGPPDGAALRHGAGGPAARRAEGGRRPSSQIRTRRPSCWGCRCRCRAPAGRAAMQAREFADALRAVLDVPVELQDERLTTVEAERRLAASGVEGQARRRVVDRTAAAVILQAWLDARSAEPTVQHRRRGRYPRCPMQDEPTPRRTVRHDRPRTPAQDDAHRPVRRLHPPGRRHRGGRELLRRLQRPRARHDAAR